MLLSVRQGQFPRKTAPIHMSFYNEKEDIGTLHETLEPGPWAEFLEELDGLIQFG